MQVWFDCRQCFCREMATVFHIKEITHGNIVFLCSFTQEAKTSFLKWLQKRADQSGLLTLPKASLRMVSCSELLDGPVLPEGSLAMVIDSSESQSWAQFSMETYSKNLKTSILGRTVLYAEVATSTMDLLEG